jgi:uncharacterized protein YfiM (DUF2279 family)
MTPRSAPNASEFKTSDLYYAAYLKAAGVEMKRTDRDADSNRILFVFDTSVSNLAELKEAWFNSTGKVVANTYAFHIKNLKSVCHMK